eukprot:CAMPEP_0115035848 /NCGR_PEP_ID=MMETSP0216-20121206/41745_1 /TAXON_ID=223996 /ORGANISM="Protocruzia adherens, Strain Boccale" /LENGTH=495 /DNA_ID=CAMNT_0002415511 /DNA_START=56 /DNA_END=1544 /DNA_ORIENTATION=-
MKKCFRKYHKVRPYFPFQGNHTFSSQDTIYALSTPPGKGGIAVVRVSGPNAQDVTKLASTKISKLTPKMLKYTTFINPFEERKLLDKGYMVYFAKNGSFTGEETVELHIHGGKAVQQSFLNCLSRFETLRAAGPGEFSKQALFNGRLDLLELEGLADVINAETELQKDQALNQMTGQTSSVLETLRKQLIKCIAHGEAFIDFEEDEIDVQKDLIHSVARDVREIATQIEGFLNDHNRGEILRDGFKISILGSPNSGKSSLLNVISRRDAAIVSDIPGTTRDVIRVNANLAGYPVILEDTAGLRETEDIIEKEGIKRALSSSQEANLTILIMDGNISEQEVYKNMITMLNESSQPFLILVNKADLFEEGTEQPFSRDGFFLYQSKDNGDTKIPVVVISCKEEQLGTFLDNIRDTIQDTIDPSNESIYGNSTIITRHRHRELLQECLTSLYRFDSHPSIDMCVEELRYAVDRIGKITGRIDVEEILDKLFQDFCIGK